MKTGDAALERHFPLILAIIALAGWVIRILPLLPPSRTPAFVGGDEAVYFTSSALLFKGVLPYRDFVFVHPPGSLYVFGLISAFIGPIDAAHALTASMYAATLAGAANIALAGSFSRRLWGPFAGVVAAACYALLPEVVFRERGPSLEAVLNSTCLAMAWAWVGMRTDFRRRHAVIAGVLAGFAVAVKLWGVFWIVAALASVPRHWRIHAWTLVGAAAAAAVALIAPLALLSPAEFFTDVVWYQLFRPPDAASRLVRLSAIYGSSAHWLPSILALVAIADAVQNRLATRAFTFFTTAYALLVLSFLLAPFYTGLYGAHLALPECLLAGAGAHVIWARLRPRASHALAALAIAFGVTAVRPDLLRQPGYPPVLVVGDVIRQMVPAHACVFAADPVLTLAAGRLPPYGDRAPVIVDSYAGLSIDAMRQARTDGRGIASLDQVLNSPGSQRHVRPRLEACRYVVLDHDHDSQWPIASETQAWFDGHFVRRYSSPKTTTIEIWERER